jgi:hypothetical protein
MPAKVAITAKNVSVSGAPPLICSNDSRIWSLALRIWSAASAIMPIVTPRIATPAAQAISTPRCNRHANPTGLSRLAGASAGPGRVGIMPLPKSRWRVSVNATPTSTTNRMAGSARTHHRSSSKGRVC